MEDDKEIKMSNLSLYSRLILIFDCLLVAYLYNSTNLPIQICFGIISFIVFITSILVLIRIRNVRFLLILKYIFESKNLDRGSLLGLVFLLLLHFFTPGYREIISYFFLGVGMAILIVNIIKYITSRKLT